MAHFAGQREIGVKFPMRAASEDPKSTQFTPLTMSNQQELHSHTLREHALNLPDLENVRQFIMEAFWRTNNKF